MRCARLTIVIAAIFALLSATGCEAVLIELLTPRQPARQAQLIFDRYKAGHYAGTIDSTRDDPTVVYHFTYQNGVTLWALLLLHEQTGDPACLQQVAVAMAKYDADNLYRPTAGDEPIDYLGAMAHATLEYALRSGDERCLENALLTARYFHNDVARTPEGLIAYHADPQRGRIWADALFMVTPLMAKAGKLLDDPSYYDDVLAQFSGFSERLRDPLVGLYHQGWNWHGSGASPGYWGRANGWVLVAMTEVLDTIPTDHPGFGELLSLYQDFAAAIVTHQGVGGLWHQLLNRPDTYEEISCTGLFLYGLARGVERGWLPGEYTTAIQRGYAGLARMISADGDIANVCPGTSTQASEGAYRHRGPRRNDSHGIGPALLGTCAAMITPTAPE